MINNLEKNIIMNESILNCRICSSESIDQALEYLQLNSPAGTQNNWQIDDRECVKPVKCAEYPERTHYMFCC